ncbi:hypothetical protein CFOLD11_09390 [Clostridium folliculivorans]|uniref:Uncharacterized protein n=1 Tax=Clostridium folliculivorans TaxID=2886038 RepID=A0A9W5Y016_9CLOT|nr:hypothetical protein [Clostridium folliculivorans]GKU24113.1 hypothetical protein CFOLD11_09390 [Clostridium folliculivorans]
MAPYNSRYLLVLLIPILFLITVLIYALFIGKLSDSILQIKKNYSMDKEITFQKHIQFYIFSRIVLILILISAFIFKIKSDSDSQSLFIYIILIPLIIYLCTYCFLIYKDTQNLVSSKGIVTQIDTESFDLKSPYNRRTIPIFQRSVAVELENNKTTLLKSSIALLSIGDNIEVCYTEKLRFIYKVRKLT